MVYPRVDGGTKSPLKSRRFVTGSIPAWTGEPLYGDLLSPQPPVYPRVDGGTPTSPVPINNKHHGGVYPRVDGGTVEAWSWISTHLGSIPAWTGEPQSARIIGRCLFRGLSPRGRGNLGSVHIKLTDPLRVYPRVDGGTSSCSQVWE